MKTIILVFLLGLGGVMAVTHSMKYFYTASSGIPNFPEFLVFGVVDDVQMIYCDSNTSTVVPRQDWMKEFIAEYPEFWQLQTDICEQTHQNFKGNIEIAKQLFNQTGGVHLVQRMYGCEWDDETNEISGFDQHGYDGEDFIVMDLKTLTWVAPVKQAVPTKHKWENDKADIAEMKHYYSQYCPEWAKKYFNYGRRSLMRKDPPSVSLLQKTPSSPVTCHTTGFYPDRADLFWRKDGVELHEDVDKGEILPNHDGTFQMSVDLKISSIAPEDWKKYDCVFQLSGVKDDVITNLDKSVIRTNEGNFLAMIILITAAVVVLAVTGVVGVIVCKKKKKAVENTEVQDAQDVQEEMLPKTQMSNKTPQTV